MVIQLPNTGWISLTTQQQIDFDIAPTGNLSFLNRAWEEVLGYKSQASLGIALRSFVVDKDRPLIDRSMADASQQGGTRPVVRLFAHNVGIPSMGLSPSSNAN